MDFLHHAIARAETVVCIFMASIISSLSPLLTLWPTLTAMVAIRPGIGAGICRGSVRSALGRSLIFGRRCLSAIVGLAGHAVEFVGHRAAPILVRLAHVDQPDDQGLARLDRRR